MAKSRTRGSVVIEGGLEPAEAELQRLAAARAAIHPSRRTPPRTVLDNERLQEPEPDAAARQLEAERYAECAADISALMKEHGLEPDEDGPGASSGKSSRPASPRSSSSESAKRSEANHISVEPPTFPVEEAGLVAPHLAEDSVT